MRLLLRLGFRNLWRNKRRTLITMSAMAFSTALLIVTLGLTEGSVRDMLDSATGLYYGHAQITAKGYREDRDPSRTLPAGAASQLAQDPAIRGAAGRVSGFALLSCGPQNNAETMPAELLGVDPRQEEAVSHLSSRILAGHDLDGPATHGMLLGRELARQLNAKVGDSVVVMGQAVDGSVADALFTVRGLVDTGNSALDGSLALVGRTTLQQLLGLDGRIQQVVVALKDPMRAPQWAKQAAPRFPGAEISSWQDLLPQLTSLLAATGAGKFITIVVFYTGVLLVTVNTMYMAQLERLREFAVMGAIGLKPWRLVSLIVIEGALMSSIAALFGGVAGSALSAFLETHPITLATSSQSISMAGANLQTALGTVPTWDGIVLPIALMMLLGGLISLFPAWRLGRLRPVDALREV
ncbi:MAG: ABC transporter permease [Cyanobacteria bacterium REEB65]|nr:ABC transporter permease [Cyanobacteria bacterium REEB65]